jgi:hypothetical protein
MQLSQLRRLFGLDWSPMWEDSQKGHCLYPWEAVALSILFSHPSRQCIATVVRFGEAMVVPPIPRHAQLIVQFQRLPRESHSLRAPKMQTTWSYNCMNPESPLWEAESRNTSRRPHSREYLTTEHLRHLECPPALAASLSVLPSSKTLLGCHLMMMKFLVGAVTEHHFDLFCNGAAALPSTGGLSPHLGPHSTSPLRCRYNTSLVTVISPFKSSVVFYQPKPVARSYFD